MVRDRVSTVGARRGGADFRRMAFLGGVEVCIVSMNNEPPPINLRAERKKFCENINTAVLGITCIAFWKRVE
jgi:hypothetical protein